MSNKILCVLHYLPIELYPPVVNLLQEVDPSATKKVILFSSLPEQNLGEVALSKQVQQRRLPNLGKKSRLLRLLLFLKQQWGVYQSLRKIKPSHILYYETISSLPVLLYLLLRKKDKTAVVAAHYHEYVSPKEYQQGMFLVRLLHGWEKKYYPYYSLISQTNEQRLTLFNKDHQREDVATSFPETIVLPNYPPKRWLEKVKQMGEFSPEAEQKVRLVYVGAVSLETMYFQELFDFLKKNEAQWTLDIYSQQSTEEVRKQIDQKDLHNVKLKGSIRYEELVSLIGVYDAGLVLYKGHIPNYVYNVPNKVYEYLSLGFSVIYPEVMDSCRIFRMAHPELPLLEINFERMELSLDEIKETFKKRANFTNTKGFCAEDIYGAYLRKLGFNS